ncbi:MAG: SpoIIE family protein phosphatase [Acidobacteria bacterium]|nr:SpoIIE family protein phosphatase [Acidobacteriota bacterium]
MPIAALQRKLEHAVKEMDASSCIFYIRDPHWINEYRLVAMTGVKREETMYGFLNSESTRSVVFKGELEIFNSDAFRGAGSRELHSTIDNIPEDIRALFGDFGQRENVKSSARLIQTNEAGEREAILFVNFSRKIEFDDSMKKKIRALFNDLTPQHKLAAIKQHLIKSDAAWIGQATKIVSPAWSVTKFDFSVADKPERYFNDVIQAVLKALDIAPDTGFGTIHLYNAEEQTLALHGFFGEVKEPENAKLYSVKDWKGIVSWVAFRKRALLLGEIKESAYKKIHVSLNDEIKSELAVPLEAEGELIGVMCLECTEANKFLPYHVRSVWYAANTAAVAYMLHQHASMNQKLLKLGSRATQNKDEAAQSLKDMACLAKDYLKASYCEIWHYNSDAKRFDNAGASYEDFEPQSRPKGWTEYVRQAKQPIWITDIRNTSQYSTYYWSDEKWIEGMPVENAPTELNVAPLRQRSRHELAIPITVRGECTGVAWVKYQREGLGCPKLVLMLLALGFAAQAGLVLDSIQRREVDLKEKKSIDEVGGDIADAIRERWDDEQKNSAILDVAVASVPFHSKLGGDFYARKKIDDETVGILLVDGQGHGVQGSLHMLPLMTTFELSGDSYSAAHVISHLIKTSQAVRVRGTAIYCIISLIEKKRWLRVSSAGHDNLIIFKTERGRLKFEYYPPANGPMLGSPLSEPLMDHSLELFAGNIIVGYTDGLVDDSQNFDASQLANFVHGLLVNNREATEAISPAAIAAAIMQESEEHHPKGFRDDATVFVVRVN